jgi:hypothetical protein
MGIKRDPRIIRINKIDALIAVFIKVRQILFGKYLAKREINFRR